MRVDVIYTWIVKLGILNLFFFFALQPLFDNVQAWLRLHNISNIDFDNLWPGVTTQPLVTFVMYLLVLDFAGYWYHRWEHRIGIWWELHAVHHSQQQMSLWSDDRNHLLDDLLQASFFAAIALVIGVPPSQFVVLVAITNLAQSVQHANIRLYFGWLGERLLVSPTFHRRHHAIGYGHEGTEVRLQLRRAVSLVGHAVRQRVVEPRNGADRHPRPARRPANTAKVSGRSTGSRSCASPGVCRRSVAPRAATPPQFEPFLPPHAAGLSRRRVTWFILFTFACASWFIFCRHGRSTPIRCCGSRAGLLRRALLFSIVSFTRHWLA